MDKKDKENGKKRRSSIRKNMKDKKGKGLEE
jgi:hypothetical protein